MILLLLTYYIHIYMSVCCRGGSEPRRKMAESRSAQTIHAKGYSEEALRGLNMLRLNDELCDFSVSAQGKSFKVRALPV